MKAIEKFYRLNNDNDTIEICLVLFTKCNLNCAFCFQDRNEISLDYIHSIPINLKIQLQELLLVKQYTKVVYRIWGGELFSNDIHDSMFIEYRKLTDELYSIGKQLKLETIICFSSNLVFTNRNRVKELLQDTNAIIATSYDPLYRFKSLSQVCLWDENAKLFNPCTVSITLTKQNINEYIRNEDHFNLLKDYSVNIEYYIYNKLYDFFKPSEDDLYNFFKYCIDNDIKNIPEVQLIIDSYKNPNGRYCTCNNSCLYLNGKLTFNCLKRSSNLPQEQFFDAIPNDTDYTEQQLKLALHRKNCILCENYSFCRMYCMASVLHKSYDNKNCALSRIYKYIGEKYGK